jgi:hypothetical protein
VTFHDAAGGSAGVRTVHSSFPIPPEPRYAPDTRVQLNKLLEALPIPVRHAIQQLATQDGRHWDNLVELNVQIGHKPEAVYQVCSRPSPQGMYANCMPCVRACMHVCASRSLVISSGWMVDAKLVLSACVRTWQNFLGESVWDLTRLTRAMPCMPCLACIRRIPSQTGRSVSPSCPAPLNKGISCSSRASLPTTRPSPRTGGLASRTRCTASRSPFTHAGATR